MAKRESRERFIISIDNEEVHFSKTLYVHQNAEHNQVEYSAKNMFSIKSPELIKKLLDIVKKKRAYKSRRQDLAILKKRVRRAPMGKRGAIIQKWKEDRKRKKRKKSK